VFLLIVIPQTKHFFDSGFFNLGAFDLILEPFFSIVVRMYALTKKEKRRRRRKIRSSENKTKSHFKTRKQ
jgi:hypothetical protein